MVRWNKKPPSAIKPYCNTCKRPILTEVIPRKCMVDAHRIVYKLIHGLREEEDEKENRRK